MRITIRGVSVIFDTTFTDVDGVATNPDTAVLRISYPTDDWPLDGTDRLTTDIDLVNDVGTNWTGTWVSSVSNPGVIFWKAYGLTDGVETGTQDGDFKLRGNLANLSFTNT